MLDALPAWLPPALPFTGVIGAFPATPPVLFVAVEPFPITLLPLSPGLTAVLLCVIKLVLLPVDGAFCKLVGGLIVFPLPILVVDPVWVVPFFYSAFWAF